MALKLVELPDGTKARVDLDKGIFIDPPFGRVLMTESEGQDVTHMKGFLHRGKFHLCCWAWRFALIVPALHVLLHLLGLPHPEVLSFIP